MKTLEKIARKLPSFARYLASKASLRDKGKSPRLSSRSPGNAKPAIDARIRRTNEMATRRRSATSIVTERAAPQHPGNFASLVSALGPLPYVA